jgi:predicted HAD superfamily Cof-like phosphohydrolase
LNIIDRENVWIDTPAATLVADFNQAFGNEIANQPMSQDDIGTELEEMLFGLIGEEMDELSDARQARDLLGIIDALQDLKYVIYGYELRLGISSEEHFAEVHYANMRKLGPDGKPIRRDDGKIIKPEGWTGPDHGELLAQIAERGCIFP